MFAVKNEFSILILAKASDRLIKYKQNNLNKN